MPALPQAPTIPQLSQRAPEPPDRRLHMLGAWAESFGATFVRLWTMLVHTVNALCKVDTLANRPATPELNETFFFTTDTSRLFVGAGGAWAAVDGSLPVTIIDAKGDLIVGTAADAAARLAVGANLAIPIADSTQATGIRWTTATPTTQVFNASGTYTPTAGMKYALVIAKAGGGSGGGTSTATGNGGGGGEGETSFGWVTAAQVGASQAVTIPAAAAAIAANTNANGNTGGTVSLGTLVTAVGGVGGTTGNNGGAGGAGGNGGTSQWNEVGIQGGHGSVNLAATTALSAQGGGRGGNSISTAGVANSGGGGGGGTTAAASGAGAQGRIVVIEYYV